MQSVLAQSSNVPFVQFRNAPFCQRAGDAKGDDRVDEASATPPEGRRGGRLTQAEAGRQMGLTTRQVKRLVAA